jgi:hypothetical protein
VLVAVLEVLIGKLFSVNAGPARAVALGEVPAWDRETEGQFQEDRV